MFVDRQAELAFLDSLLLRDFPSRAQLILFYGRRRVGKTVLLRHWAEASGLPHTYWAAEKEPAGLQRRKLFAAVLGIEPQPAVNFDTWDSCWQAVARVLSERRTILILDEITYAAESDPAFLSALQHAWDQLFKLSQTVIILCGSHIHIMETLQAQQSPLFGRFTGQWHLRPLEFAHLQEFFPTWSMAERVALYAIVGGVPAYLEWLDRTRGLSDNLLHVVLAPGSMFVAEPAFLLYDEVRDPRVYLAILQAIGHGNHALGDIANAALIGKTHLPAYLARLQELRLVERRVPATVPSAVQYHSRQGRYHLNDPYFRFYFRFIAPHQPEIGYRSERVLQVIQEGLRSFVGQTAFEDLCRAWVARQGMQQQLPFVPDTVGSHWDRRVQVDIVAINWRQKQVLLGECKWGNEPVGRNVIVELVAQKAPKLRQVLPEDGHNWQVSFACFARSGFTSAAVAESQVHALRLVDLVALEQGLG